MAINSQAELLRASRALLTEIKNETAEWESDLSGGQKVELRSQAVALLLESRVVLGNPLSNLTQLTAESLGTAGVELTPFRKGQIEDRFAFYYMTFTVGLQPKPGTKFARLVCELQFSPEIIVEALFPEAKWRKALSAGARLKMAVGGNLDLRAEIPDVAVARQGMAAKGESKNEAGGYIDVPEFSYHLGDVEIVAKGKDGSRAYWRLEATQLQAAQDVRFCVVFKAPQDADGCDLTGIAFVEPDINWLAGNLRDVVPHFVERLKKLFVPRETPRTEVEQLPIGESEVWRLPLGKKLKANTGK